MNDYLMIILDEIIISVNEKDKEWNGSGQFAYQGGGGPCCINAQVMI